MSGSEERSAAEREAARLERERRRAERRGGNGAPAGSAGRETGEHEALPADTASDPSDPFDPFDPSDPSDPSDRFDPSDPFDPFDDEPFEEEPFEPYVVPGAADYDHQAGEAEEGGPGESLGELPSGTKRVKGARRVRLRGERPDAGRRNRPGRPPVRRRHSWRVRVASILVLGLAGALIWSLVELFQPFHGSPHGSLLVTIPPHSSAGQIGDLLERDGVISSSFFFQVRATLVGERGELRSGRYRLQLGMSYGEALKVLTTAPKPAKVTNLTLTEGRTRRQIDALLRAQRIRGSYVAATRHSRLLDPRRYGAPRRTPSLEGFLFPSTYQLREPIRISALVSDQLKTFRTQFRKVNLGFARSKHLTPYNVLTIASMIEAESATAHDRPLIASVIYNRLADRMPLQIDATTRYATGNYGHPLTVSELRSRSPYNTRIHKGLPPTPIDNPGMAAIQAAAHPAHTSYLYFVVKPCGNGEQAFASSFRQFEKLAQKYQSARARRGGRSPSRC